MVRFNKKGISIPFYFFQQVTYNVLITILKVRTKRGTWKYIYTKSCFIVVCFNEIIKNVRCDFSHVYSVT